MYISDNAELAENKLTLLYILKNIGIPISNTRFTQLINEGNFFNFFLFQHLLEDLLTNGYLQKDELPDGESTYLITAKGSETLSFLIHKLPKGVRKHIDKLTQTSVAGIRKDNDIISYITPSDSGGFISVLEIKDNGNLLFSLKYSSATKNDALEMCEKMKMNSELIYSQITEVLLS